MTGSSTVCVTQTTSPTHSSASIGSAPRRGNSSRRPCSCTRPLMELRRHTWVNRFVSPICLVEWGVKLYSNQAWSMFPLLCSDQSSAGAIRQTVGGRAFPVAWPTIWNSLPDNVISAQSLSTYRQRLKTSVPGLVPWHYRRSPSNYFPILPWILKWFFTWASLKIHDWLID